MKITRAYTLSRETVNILNTKPNKSAFVDRAVRSLHNKEEEFSVGDIPTRQLMAALYARDNTPPYLRGVLRALLTDE